jgi:beta-lactamase class A
MPNNAWESLIDRSGGRYRVYCHNLALGRTLMRDADVAVESASTIKLPLLMLLLREVERRHLSLRKTYRVRRDQVGRNGSGILQFMYFTAPIPLYNLAFLMMNSSDNVATNVIIELLGPRQINDYLRELGLSRTRLIMAKLDFPDNFELGEPQLGATTAREMGVLMELLVTGQALGPTATRQAKDILQVYQPSTLRRLLPASRVHAIGSKTGWIAFDREPFMVLNEIAYIIDSRDRTNIMSVFADVVTDPVRPYSSDASGRREFARVSAALFAALQAPA